jgi:hypothetical protein
MNAGKKKNICLSQWRLSEYVCKILADFQLKALLLKIAH